MILGVGTDLCQIARIGKALDQPRFFARVYTEGEQARIAQRAPAASARTAAGCFAAKEAIAKALGTGFCGFTPRDIEIYWDVRNAPHARLSGGAQARFLSMGGMRIHLSITHEADLAMATAILESDAQATDQQ